jgi:hypothetical protein
LTFDALTLPHSLCFVLDALQECPEKPGTSTADDIDDIDVPAESIGSVARKKLKVKRGVVVSGRS